MAMHDLDRGEVLVHRLFSIVDHGLFQHALHVRLIPAHQADFDNVVEKQQLLRPERELRDFRLRREWTGGNERLGGVN